MILHPANHLSKGARMVLRLTKIRLADSQDRTDRARRERRSLRHPTFRPIVLRQPTHSSLVTSPFAMLPPLASRMARDRSIIGTLRQFNSFLGARAEAILEDISSGGRPHTELIVARVYCLKRRYHVSVRDLGAHLAVTTFRI